MRKPIQFGKYLLLNRISVGGMAEVFLAKSFGVEGFERFVAIKKILPTMVEDVEFITMFIDEARIAVQLNHASIVQIYELGKQDENYFIAMEYVAGRDLRTLLDRAKKAGTTIPQGNAVYIAQKMCEGLDYAHRKTDSRGRSLGIIHRDVSPQNVIISYEGEVKLIDFGIAKARNRAQKTQAGILKGKFGYMSPEQVCGLPIDNRSDIFPLGVCLYEMLTGEKLFASDSDFSMLEMVRKAEVRPPRQFNKKIPKGLEAVVMKALARDVDDRYRWASDMQEDLMPFLLHDNRMYGSKYLADYMHEGFGESIEKEKEALQEYALMEAPEGMDFSAYSDNEEDYYPDPDEHFSDSDSEFKAPDSDDATQLFDPSNHFAPGKAGSTETTDGSADNPLPPEPEVDRGLFEGFYGYDGAAAGARDDTHLHMDEPESPVTGEMNVPSDQLQSAVERFASEIPSAPAMKAQSSPGMESKESSLKQDPVSLDNISSGLELDIPKVVTGVMEGETRITSPEEIVEISDSVLKAPSQMPRELTGSTQLGPPPKKKVRTAVPAYGTETRNKSGGMFKGILLGTAIVAVVTSVIILIAGLDRRSSDTSHLTIITMPATGVEILINGRIEATKSPYTAKVQSGIHTVTVRHPQSGRSRDATVQIGSGENSHINIELGPAILVRSEGKSADTRDNARDLEQENIIDIKRDDPKRYDSGNRDIDNLRRAGKGDEPPLKGIANIETVPEGATVYYDGRNVGKTPVVIDDLSMEEVHRFTLSLSNYRDRSISITFEDDSEIHRSVTLQRIRQPRRAVKTASRTEKTVRQPAAGNLPGKASVQKQPEPEKTVRTGTLIIMTNPSAEVFVNNRSTGVWTPVVPRDPLVLPEGVYSLSFKAADGRTYNYENPVRIEADKMQRIVGISF